MKLKEDNNFLVQGRSKSSKVALFVSDMHVGAGTALASPNPYVQETGIEVRPNKIMKRMYEIWQWCIDHRTRRPDVLGVVGEPMDGDNPKQMGQQSWSTNWHDQVNDSIKLLKEIQARNVVMVRGSGYHVHRGATNYEELVARGIGARRYRMYLSDETPDVDGFTRGALTDYIANFKLGGRIFNMTHHIGFSKNEMYRTTGMAREMVTTKLGEDFYGKADVIVRGHVHYHVRVGFTHTQGFTNPAWKLPDAHLFRGGQGGTKPDIGMVEVIIEPNGDVMLRPLIVETELKPTVLDFDRTRKVEA